MGHYSPRQLAEFKAVLSRRRAALAAEIRTKLAETGGGHGAPDVPTTTDGGDKALLDLASEIGLGEIRRDVEELQDIEAAQARLAGGSFGQCTECGERIALERLRAWPTAKRCTPCQQAHEQRRGATRGAKL